LKKWYLFGALSAADLLFVLDLNHESIVVNVLIIVILVSMAGMAVIGRKIRKGP
jgi:hypothetical protein